MATSVIGNLSAILSLKSSQFHAGMKKAEKSMRRFSRRMDRMGQTMTRSVTVPMGLMAAGTVKAFSDFDGAMNESLAIMGDVSDAMRKDMSQAARDVSKNVTFSAKQSAEAFFFLASAGLDAKASIAALPAVSKFAQAGAFDLAQATDLLTDAQSALGLTIRDDAVANMENMVDVSDVLVKANTLANASVSQFSTALTSKAGAALKSFNIDMEEGVAVLASFADQGVKAELAGNALDRILRLLPKSATNNAEAFERLNIEVFDSQGNLNNLGEIIEDLENALRGMSDEQKFATLEMLGFEARVQAIIKPLLGTSDAIKEYEKELRKAGGTTKEVSDKQLEGFGNKLKLIRNRVVNAAIKIGETLAPTVLALGEKIAKVADALSDLNPRMLKWGIGIAGAVAALGPLMLALSAITSGLLLLTGPAGLIALTFIAFGTLGATLRRETNPALKEAKEAHEALQRVLRDTSASDEAKRSSEERARAALEAAKKELQAAKIRLEASIIQDEAGLAGFVGGSKAQRAVAQLEGKINKLEFALKGMEEAARKSEVQIGKITVTTDDLNSAVEDMIDNNKDLFVSVDKATDSMEDMNDEMVRAAGEFNNFADAFLDKMPMMSPPIQSLADTLQSVGIGAKDAKDNVVELSDEFQAALAETEQQIIDQRRVWDNLIDGVQGAWVGFFKDTFQGKGLDSIKSFLSRVKDLFFNLIAEIAAKWTAAKIFGGSFNIGGLSLGGGGNIGSIGGAGKAISAGASKLFGALKGGGALGAVEAGTGATATAGLSSAIAAAAPAAAVLAMPFIAKELFGGGNNIFGQFQGFTGRGGLGTQVAGGDGVSFAGGPMAGFAGQVAESRGVPTFTSEDRNLTQFNTELETLKKILAEAETEFESLKKSAAKTFNLGEKGAVKVGQAIKDGLVSPTELANLGLIEMGERITHAETGAVSLGEVTTQQFQRIVSAVNQGTFRLEALRGETRLNQQEIAFLGQQGLTAAQLIQGGFEAASGGVRALRDESVSAAGEMASAFRGAADAAASIGSGGGGAFGGDPNSDRGLTNQLRDDAQRGPTRGGGGK